MVAMWSKKNKKKENMVYRGLKMSGSLYFSDTLRRGTAAEGSRKYKKKKKKFSPGVYKYVCNFIGVKSQKMWCRQHKNITFLADINFGCIN